MQIPSSTYRVQFNLNFRFADAEALVPYLHHLGISHLYASPRFKARKGSSHGYDIADPIRVNSELGTEEEFDRLASRLHQYGMGLLLDIVPNHMAASSENPWWMDVLENGRSSRHAEFFDIDWEPEGIKLSTVEKGRVILPILGAHYDEILLNQGIRLRFDDRGFFFQYEDHRFPLDPATYSEIITLCMENLDPAQESSLAALQELQRISSTLPERHNSEFFFDDRERIIGELKSRLWHLYHSEEPVRQSLDEALRILNGVQGEPASFHRLHALLSMQAYRLAYWRLAAKEVNYRRFFDINDLVGLRIEDPLVFSARHAAIMRLVQEEKVSGLRVDHIDGLLDPWEYLERLKSIPVSNNHAAANGPSIFTIVEKIICGDESLPAEWACSGTTGYDFLNALNALFVHPEGYRNIDKSYRKFAGINETFADTWYQRNKQVIDEHFVSDLDLLSYRLGRIAAADLHGRDLPIAELIAGIKEVSACLPVYRTYYRNTNLSARDRVFLEQALSAVHRRAAGVLSEPTLHFLRRVFFAELPFEQEDSQVIWLEFILRWQQFTGAVMAKGLEDTALFVNHPLISVNEVGNTPFHAKMPFGVDAFHEFNSATLASYPHTLTTTATHDTKWSEDVRARLNVLSEIPNEWNQALRRWSRTNQRKKTNVNGKPVPTPNEEVIFYQAMLGIWPVGGIEDHHKHCLQSRLENFFIKAVREAKTETDWLRPNEPHESALRHFVSAIFSARSGDPFLSDFAAFHERIAFLGALNSCSQLILKATSPGVPDFYQGSEGWNLALTDPDNRRPVDFRHLQSMLEHLKGQGSQPSEDWMADVLRNWPDGRLKFYFTMRLLNFRRSHHEPFAEGDYLPLAAHGSRSESVFAFARRFQDHWIVVAVPRLLRKIATHGRFPVGHVWRGSSLVLPGDAPVSWFDVLTNQTVELHRSADSPALPLQDLFGHFPFAVLSSANGNGQRS